MRNGYQPFDWYETPLYYDIVFDGRTAGECDFLVAMCDRYAPTRGRRLLEPACGTGRLLAGMAARGYRVAGFDASPGSVAFARRRLADAGLEGELFEARMEAFRVRRRFDLAYCLISTFKYLLTEGDARAHLQAVADALKPGGVYALGFHLTDYAAAEAGGLDRERWVGERDGTRVVCNIQSWPPDRRERRERVRSRLVVSERGNVRRFETHWEFRTYSAAQFRALLRAVPAFDHVATYDFDYDPDQPVTFGDGQLDHVVILRKNAR